MNRDRTVSTKTRSAKEADATALADLAGQLGYPNSPDELRARLASIRRRTDHTVLVAEAEGAVVGWIHIFGARRIQVDPFAEVGGFVIDSSHRGRGIGGALLKAAEAWAMEKGFRLMRIRSNVIRREAHAFYEKQGYGLRKQQGVFEKALSG